jgi:hypothetical protein
MPARTQNSSQQVLLNPSHVSVDAKYISTCETCQRGHIMYLNSCCSVDQTCVDQKNLINASDDKKSISTNDDQVLTLRARTDNASLLCRTNTTYIGAATKCISTNPSNETEDSIRISTCVEQTHPMPTITQHVSQHVLNKHIPCQREQ